uniref:Phlebovirus glycoprotein G2 fusion domain-containing protein n=1 Tax=Meloidogyne incognita TaxID=6306 RepID=A0A914KSM7_MELIC
MGIVDITIEDIVVECQKSSEYFSRSHEVKTYSSKRCPKQGSCTGNTCANTKLNSKIPELNAVNDLPGNTFCIDSCSFLMCGCGFPTTSCIFYRLHAVERSKKIYEFFNCPAWQYAIELAIKRTNDKGTTQIDKIRLYNGILTETNGLKLAINAITKAPTPILATRFLTDDDKVMIADHLNSKLYCATQGEAESFSGCQLDADACKCSVTDPTVTCQCKNGRLDKIILENPAKVLPIISQNFALKNEKNRLYASLPHASIALQVSMENYQLIATHDRVRCEISPRALIGCYSCISGASFDLNCTPSFGNGALAFVYCVQKSGKHFEFSLFCNGQHKIPLALENADISANCTVNCPAGETNFKLKGKLKYIIQQNWLSLIHAQSTQALAENSIDWAFLGYFFLGLPQSLFLLAATFLAIVVIIILIRVNPIHKIWKLIFRIIIILIIITNSNSLIYSNKMNNEQLSNISPASSPTNSENSNIYYGPAPPPLEAEIVSSAAPDEQQELQKWWVEKSAKGKPSTQQKKEYGAAAGFKKREDFLKDCKEKAKKMPPLLRAVQTLQLAAVNSQKEAGKVDPETGKITRPTTTVEITKNDSNEYEGRGFKLDHEGLSHNEIEKVEGLLKLGAELTKQALLLHEQYKRSASMKRKAEIAIVKTRNELESSNIHQQKYSSNSIRYNPYNQQKNSKNDDSKTWQCNVEKGYGGFGK